MRTQCMVPQATVGGANNEDILTGLRGYRRGPVRISSTHREDILTKTPTYRHMERGPATHGAKPDDTWSETLRHMPQSAAKLCLPTHEMAAFHKLTDDFNQEKQHIALAVPLFFSTFATGLCINKHATTGGHTCKRHLS